MSLWRIAWSYLWNRKFTTALTIISVALGVGLISAVLTLREETERRFVAEGQSFDIVVGAKGNPLQLVLSTVYFLGPLTGNIEWSDYERLRNEEEVAGAYPIGMGDTYRGFRIVGTVPELFEHDWGGGRNPYKLADGKYFEKPMEAVIGAAVAADSRRGVGDKFIGTHGVGGAGGHEHKHHPYTVVGVLERSGTPNDRAIFCSLDSVWQIHQEDPCDNHGGEGEEDLEAPAEDEVDARAEAHVEGVAQVEGEAHDPGEAHDSGDAHDPGDAHDHHGHGAHEVTAVLVALRSPGLRFTFKERVNKGYNAMAAIPVQQIRDLYDQLLGTAKAVLLAIGYLVVVISALSILIGLYMSILQRKRDLAIMRALGASSGEIFGSVIIEAFWVTVLGLCAGWVLGSFVCYCLGMYLSRTIGFSVPPVVWTADIVSAYSAVVLMGMVAGLLPAWQAYHTDVARDLAEL
ncbi:MAG: ABC transporter permease [Candidatus Hydrogenedentes bacterium]|nr:ABC transporter permease [Candidatus Hydrogenedentota bacterium]